MAVVYMTGPAGFVRIVPHLRTLLMPVERLDGHIDAQNPRQHQRRRDARNDLFIQPLQPLSRIHTHHGLQYHILAHGSLYSKQAGVYPIPSD
jgi:hypothetical protein